MTLKESFLIHLRQVGLLGKIAWSLLLVGFLYLTFEGITFILNFNQLYNLALKYHLYVLLPIFIATIILFFILIRRMLKKNKIKII
jgi:hypothetical protein